MLDKIFTIRLIVYKIKNAVICTQFIVNMVNTTTFTFSIPSYTVLDASLFYDRPKFRIGLKVDNLTNEKYWSYRLAAQNPTKVTGNITLKF